MNTLKEKITTTSALIENQLPSFVADNNPKFISFLNSYYESQETKYNSLDLVKNFIEYYNIGSYTSNSLIQSTKLSQQLLSSQTTITVDSTLGFPEQNGYLMIEGEIIFYKSKTKTQFKDCVRGTGAFILEKIPSNQIIYKNGTSSANHASESVVTNVAYYFVEEFLRRIKTEISPVLPQKLSKNLNLITFLKNIKSFYSTKGTQFSHKILFRILFNDKLVKLRLVNSGTGAKINILNYTGKIDEGGYEVKESGSGYYLEYDGTGNLIGQPIIEILGSGTGSPKNNLIPNSASMKVTGMTLGGGIAQNGIEVTNEGTGYVGPITARIRDRNFDNDQEIECVDINGNVVSTAKVYSWDSSSRELTLYDVEGFFYSGYRIIGKGGENPRSKISLAYPKTLLNKEGNPSIEIISKDPEVELPRNYTIQSSGAKFYKRTTIRCELISGDAIAVESASLIQLTQKSDKTYNIKGTSIEVSSINNVGGNFYEFEVDDSLQYKKLFLPASTKITSSVTIPSVGTGVNLNVLKTTNFPEKNGRLHINGKLVEYTSKTPTTFTGCKVINNSAFSVSSLDNCYLQGRRCTPNHISYFLTGYINGAVDNPLIFRLVSLPSEPIIENPGCLYFSKIHEFENQTISTKIKSKSYQFGSIDSVIIENAGSNYKIFDNVLIDENSSIGSGFYAYVSEISGKPVESYDFTRLNSIDYITITTSSNHNLQTEDVVYFNQSIGKQKIFSVLSNTKFLIPKPSSLTDTNLLISYTTNSKTSSGSIVKISISNKGNNYNKLPLVLGIKSDTGIGAIIQLNSSTIGRISDLEYASVSGELIGDKITKYPIKFGSTAKIINNFQLSKINIISAGDNYRSSDKISINGTVNESIYKFKISTSASVLSSIEVIRGGNNLSAFPQVQIISDTGSGASLQSEISRKHLYENDILYLNSLTSPTGVCKVIYFDTTSSTLEFEVISGTTSNNDIVYLSDGSIYGNIISISTASAYATPFSYVKYPHKFLDNYGFLNDSTQKIHDSVYYQDWSYLLNSSRNIFEWKNEVLQNTHPSGFKVYGKNTIEKINSIYQQDDIVKGSLILKSSFNNLAELNLRLSNCKTQKLYLGNTSSFNVSDYVYSPISKAKGIVKEVNDNFIEVYLYNTRRKFDDLIFDVNTSFYELTINELNVSENFPIDNSNVYVIANNSYELLPNTYNIVSNGIIIYNTYNFEDFDSLKVYQTGTEFDETIYFIDGEYVYEVDEKFIFENIDDTSKLLYFYDGIMQQPYRSYIYSNDTFITNFNIDTSKQSITSKLTTDYENLNYLIQDSQLKLIKNFQNFSPISKENLIISIDGVIQSPNSFTLNGNVVQLSESVTFEDNVFVLYHEKFKSLTFTGSGTTYTLNYTPSSACRLLIFANGVYQTHLVTDYSVSGNVLTLSESVSPANILGWYIDESVICSLLNIQNINQFKILNSSTCSGKLFTTYIETRVNASPNSYYEFTKNLMDGTVYSDTSTNTLYGYNTRFKYSTPEYSTSYVEVLNPITFNGSAKTFSLTYINGISYTPVNGESNLMVYIDNTVLDYDKYSISGSSITFVDTYNSSNNCTIIDFASKYRSNNITSKGSNLDRLNVVQNGTKKIFNLSDRGVPQYVRNVEDLFVIKNGTLQIPNSTTQSISNNKVTLQTAPVSTDALNILYFNRQLLPSKTKNLILDGIVCFDGIRTSYPLSIDGIYQYPVSIYHLFVIRHGVHQQPLIDYTISTTATGSFINFSVAPENGENIIVYYSYNGLNQNFIFDTFKFFNGTQNTFSLTANYISADVLSSSHIQVYKNQEYQYPQNDYTVSGGTGYKYIQFSTPPTTSDNFHIVNFTTDDLVDVTSRFSQQSTTSLLYTPATPSIDTNVFLIYINGILQVKDSWSFNTTTQILSLTQFVSLSLDDVRILAFKTARRKFDTINTVNGTNTYTLTVNSNNITTNLPTKNSDLIVIVNGIVQNPSTAFSVSGNSLTLNGPVNSGSTVNVYQVGMSSSDTQIIDYLNDNFSKSTYKLQQNYKSFNPPSTSDIFILRHGVAQNPGEDFVVGNGYITFTTNITDLNELVIMYRHASSELTVQNTSNNIITLSSSVASNEYKNIVVYLNGVPQFNEYNFTMSNNTIILDSIPSEISSLYVIKYSNITFYDPLDDCPDGERTKFRTLLNLQNLVSSDIISNADIIILKNGIILYPGVEYTLTAGRGMVQFSSPLNYGDQLFMIKMYGNQVINLTSVSGSSTVFDLSSSIPSSDQEDLVIFSNNLWRFSELGQFTYNSTSRITLSSAKTSQYAFGIKFFGLVKLLDQIHTPYNGSNNKFNLFLNEENFMPTGTIENTATPSETSILVVKNGKVLDPGVDYTLQGDIKSQIEFASAPISTDVISVKSVGSFLKLKSITSGFGGKVYDLKTQDNSTYYPNALISRPREHENQILVIKDGNIQSPLQDYYIDNDKLIFMNNVTASKLVILDFMGTIDDVKVDQYQNQVEVGETIFINGESSGREVTEIISPTILKTKSIQGPFPSGFTAASTVSNGKLSSITITNGGTGYGFPVILRTKGVGTSAKATASVDRNLGNKVTPPISIEYPGYNLYQPQQIVATSYAYYYKKTPLNTSSIKIATRLTSNINSTAEIIPIANSSRFDQSDIIITINSSSGSGATFRPFVSNGRIRKIEVINQGIGYDDRDVTLTVSGGGGSGCVLSPVLDSMGRLTSITVRNGGEGYDTFKIMIYNEIIEYTNIVSNQLIGCTRGSFAISHTANTLIYYDKFI